MSIADKVDSYRDAGLDAVFRNFPATLEVEAEERLWAAHSKVNNHFRKNISRVSLPALKNNEVRLGSESRYRCSATKIMPWKRGNY